MSADVVIKEVAPQWIVSMRKVIANYHAIGDLYPKVVSQVGNPDELGMPIAIWHDKEHKEHEVDGEAGFLLKRPLAAHGTAQVYELAGGTVASYMHHGAFNRLDDAYQNLMHWVKENHYHVTGAFREFYHHLTRPVTEDNESYVTEIQVPVIKG